MYRNLQQFASSAQTTATYSNVSCAMFRTQCACVSKCVTVEVIAFPSEPRSSGMLRRVVVVSPYRDLICLQSRCSLSQLSFCTKETQGKTSTTGHHQQHWSSPAPLVITSNTGRLQHQWLSPAPLVITSTNGCHQHHWSSSAPLDLTCNIGHHEHQWLSSALLVITSTSSVTVCILWTATSPGQCFDPLLRFYKCSKPSAMDVEFS